MSSAKMLIFKLRSLSNDKYKKEGVKHGQYVCTRPTSDTERP